MSGKKITVFAGHYGSGKTNLAVNYALKLRESGKEVSVCDLDIVNPYFRTKDSEKLFNEHGIRMIASEFANSNVDLPAIPSAAYSIFSAPGCAVVDLGGDDRGAYALGRFAELLEECGDYHMLLVISMYRPDTRTAADTIEVMREIEDACHVKFTGVVNNSNLGKLTDAEHVINSVGYADEVCKMADIPLVMTAYPEELGALDVPNPFPVRIYTKEYWNK